MLARNVLETYVVSGTESAREEKKPSILRSDCVSGMASNMVQGSGTFEIYWISYDHMRIYCGMS